jgi:hypothetical protein
MAMDLHAVVRGILVAKTIGVYVAPPTVQTADWSIFEEKEPSEEPSRCLTIFVRGGLPANPAWLLEYPGIQVRVRGKPNDHKTANTKAREVLDALTGYPSTTYGSDRLVGIWNTGDVINISQDQNSRPVYVVNFRTIIEPASSGITNRQPL